MLFFKHAYFAKYKYRVLEWKLVLLKYNKILVNQLSSYLWHPPTSKSE